MPYLGLIPTSTSRFIMAGNGGSGFPSAVAPRPPSLPIFLRQLPIAAPATTPTSSAPAATPTVPAATAPAPISQPSVLTASTPSGASVAVAAPPPGSYPTNQTYTDAAGNVWSWDPTNGWQITSPAASNVTTGIGLANFVSSIGGWLQSETLLSFLPNWATLGSGAVALYLAMSMLGGKKRR